MNTHDAYERRLDPELPEQAPDIGPEVPSVLAVHGDLSRIPTASQRGTPPPPCREIAWVRPSELPTVVMTPMVGRGIDLQSELARRARRGPATASRASRRITRSAIAQPEPSTPTEGVQL